MRALLEFLGIVRPAAARREPIALPAWIRGAAPLVLAATITVLSLVSTGVWLLVRSLLP